MRASRRRARPASAVPLPALQRPGGHAAAADSTTAQAVFSVHELETPVGNSQARGANSIDLERFMATVFADPPRHGDRSAWIAGPVHIPEATEHLRLTSSLYVVKLSTVAV
jgi:hypothetical protein